MSTKAKPLGVYTVREYVSNGEKLSAWTKIGVAFPHKKGPGLNIVLEALPLDGKITVYPQSDKKPGQASEQTATEEVPADEIPY